ncbi:MAG TPA: amino acid ABC transporter permease [Ktedonobacteraceae bacterium]|nr:amino acid ABC transporter permease [Ktedonobacteraceae bacterium]
MDYLFFVLLAVFLLGIIYYFYSYRTLLLIDFPVLLQGAGTTIFLSVMSMVLATIFGFLGAMGRLSHFALFRWIAFVYVEVVRGTPILVQLYLWGFGLSGALSSIGVNPHTIAYQFMTLLQSNSLVPDENTFNAAFYGILGLSFNYGAYLTEVFRTGIESVQVGQTEAALSLGLNSGQTLWRVVLPQAFRITIPPFTNYFITLVQDSALLSTLGSVIELQQLTTALASPLSSDLNAQLFVYVFGAVLFLAICYPLALLARYLEARMAVAY